MSTYIFIYGKDHALSLAELKARYPDALIDVEGDGFVVMTIDKKIDQQEFNCLGGQMKVGLVKLKVAKEGVVESLLEVLVADHESGKLNYGVSLYGWPERNLRSVLLELKRAFKGAGVSSRFANQNFENISSAQYKGLSKGKEVLVCRQGSDYYVAEVVGAQDIDAYSKRDYDKPFRDMKVGMLPPKLAQIMINLSGCKGKLWDPFCGGGVLVMEGLMMGHEMLGSDINEETLEGAARNIEWVKQEFGLKTDTKLFVHDATDPVGDDSFDGIVFEGYLGPPQYRRGYKRELTSIVVELEKLYVDFFKAIKAASFKGPILLALPFFVAKDGDLSLDKVMSKAEKMGFKKSIHLKYVRNDQQVGREILKYELLG